MRVPSRATAEAVSSPYRLPTKRSASEPTHSKNPEENTLSASPFQPATLARKPSSPTVVKTRSSSRHSTYVMMPAMLQKSIKRSVSMDTA